MWHVILLRDSDCGTPGPISCEDCGVPRPSAVYIWNSELNVYLILCAVCFDRLFDELGTTRWMLNTTVTFKDK